MWHKPTQSDFMSDDSKSKAPKKKPKTKKPAVKKQPDRLILEASILHEKVVQDRIAGLTTKEICQRYKIDRKRVWAICDQHKERIALEVGERERERQELINKALDDDTEKLISLLGRSTDLLDRMFNETSRSIDHATFGDKPLKPSQACDLLDAATKAFDKIRAATLAQQKLSMTPVENALPS